MKITFNVGDNETHSVEFSWGQMLGTSRIRVDGQVVFRGRPVSLDEVALLANLPKYGLRNRSKPRGALATHTEMGL